MSPLLKTLYRCAQNYYLNTATLRDLACLIATSEGEPTIGELANYLASPLPGVSKTVDRLVHKNLVERVQMPSDRRKVFLRLTPRGTQLVNFITLKDSTNVAI